MIVKSTCIYLFTYVFSLYDVIVICLSDSLLDVYIHCFPYEKMVLVLFDSG